MDMKFIATTDPETRDLLIKEGFVLIPDQTTNSRWVFINDKFEKFSDIKNVSLTNKINI
jgi:hypothetical protein